jgi:hypothetical protein
MRWGGRRGVPVNSSGFGSSGRVGRVAGEGRNQHREMGKDEGDEERARKE